MTAEWPLFSLLITTQNRKDDLLRTLGAMLPILPPRHEVIVFDDGSTDGTSEAVARAFPDVRLISWAAKGGYIAARNRLLAEARGDYALTLDDDAEILTRDFSARVCRHFAANPRCAVAAFRIYWGRDVPPQTGATDIGEPGPVNSFVGCGHVWRMAAW